MCFTLGPKEKNPEFKITQDLGCIHGNSWINNSEKCFSIVGMAARMTHHAWILGEIL